MNDISENLEIQCIGALAGGSEIRSKVLSGIALGSTSVEDASYLTKCRVKEHSSLLSKVLDKREKGEPNYMPSDAKDIVGLRLLALFRKDLPRLVARFLTFIDAGQKEEFSLFSGSDFEDAVEEIVIYTAAPIGDEVDSRLVDIFKSRGLKISYDKETDPKGGDLFVKVRRKDSQYSSIHLILWCKNVISGQQKHKIPMEVQIRTSLEDVWGEIDHKLSYKNDELGDDPSSLNHIQSATENLRNLKRRLDGCADAADIIKKQMEFATPSKLKFTASVSARSVNLGTLVDLPIGDDKAALVKAVTKQIMSAFSDFSSGSYGKQPDGIVELSSRFSKAATELESIVGQVVEDTELDQATRAHSLYYLKMEAALSYYWAGRVLGAKNEMPKAAEESDSLYRNAINLYDEISRENADSHDAILAYRIANVLTARGQNELALAKLEEAVQELSGYKQENLADDHFLRVRIPRQLGLAYWEMAERLREQAAHVSLDGMFLEQRRALYLEALNTTLPLLDVDVAKAEGSVDMGAEEAADEHLKTANNLVEYALCFLRSDGNIKVLERHGVNRQRLIELVERLASKSGVDDVEIPVWGDTLRAAYEELLNDLDTAKSYARSTLQLLEENEDTWIALHSQRIITEIIDDAKKTLSR